LGQVSTDVDYELVAVDELLRRTARRLPDKVALIDGDRRLTFGEMDRQADSVAAGLANLGVVKGDRVALFSPNCIEFEVAFFGILRAGAMATTVSSAYKARELAHQIPTQEQSTPARRSRSMATPSRRFPLGESLSGTSGRTAQTRPR
jgi:acyl-CoA synthetase (AMP-forming)/AMP-acid ligase II